MKNCTPTGAGDCTCPPFVKILSTARVLGVAALLCLPAIPGLAERARDDQPNAVILPLTVGWYDGKPAAYVSTEASDPGVAKAMGANYVPRLANAAGTAAVDDIYTVTNFKQTNVIPSRPLPAGPDNKDPNYSPLWQVTTVTWKVTPFLLTSEKAVLDAAKKGLVFLNKTSIIVNCPVVFTPGGGLLPNAKLIRY